MNDVSFSTSHQAAQKTAKYPVAIVGARGYSGLELARLLLRHPAAELAACFATAGFRLSDYLPERAARSVPGLPVEALLSSIQKQGTKVVFLATPAEVSLDLTPKILEAGASVIDLSGAFRLQEGSPQNRAAQYEQWYKLEHTKLPLLEQAEFGLVPWVDFATGDAAQVSAPEFSSARLISNPGCFATAVLMAALPLFKDRLIEPSSLVIDAKSGTSGAGRKAEERLLHCEVDGLCLPYRVGRHQHEPEIQQYIRRFAGVETRPFFTPHLLNVRRGIIASLYARLDRNLKDETDVPVKLEAISSRVDRAFATVYSANPLVEFVNLDTPGSEAWLSLRRVVGSARTHIVYRIVDDRLYVFSLIDNLMKGAASQAVENLNRLLRLPTWTGLLEVEGVL